MHNLSSIFSLFWKSKSYCYFYDHGDYNFLIIRSIIRTDFGFSPLTFFFLFSICAHFSKEMSFLQLMSSDWNPPPKECTIASTKLCTKFAVFILKEWPPLFFFSVNTLNNWLFYFKHSSSESAVCMPWQIRLVVCRIQPGPIHCHLLNRFCLIILS